jgi:hypothetical protein
METLVNILASIGKKIISEAIYIIIGLAILCVLYFSDVKGIREKYAFHEIAAIGGLGFAAIIILLVIIMKLVNSP